jgi:hypothetical protein
MSPLAEESNSRMPMILVAGVIGMLLVIGGVYIANSLAPPPVHPVEVPLPMGAAEQAYVQHIQFVDTKVARAANVLNQQITFAFGTVVNNGSRNIRQIEVTLEFHDVFGQVVLKENRRLFGAKAVPLPPQGRRDFQIGYETMPAQWNQTFPTVKIIGLGLE